MKIMIILLPLFVVFFGFGCQSLEYGNCYSFNCIAVLENLFPQRITTSSFQFANIQIFVCFYSAFFVFRR